VSKDSQDQWGASKLTGRRCHGPCRSDETQMKNFPAQDRGIKGNEMTFGQCRPSGRSTKRHPGDFNNAGKLNMVKITVLLALLRVATDCIGAVSEPQYYGPRGGVTGRSTTSRRGSNHFYVQAVGGLAALSKQQKARPHSTGERCGGLAAVHTTVAKISRRPFSR